MPLLLFTAPVRPPDPEAVARRLSFSAAADELHLTQSAISRQIKSLEDELGASLFNRGTRKVELTAAGDMLRQFEQALLAMEQDPRDAEAIVAKCLLAAQARKAARAARDLADAPDGFARAREHGLGA